jgi:Ca2+-binding EF-hand superfamily protein
MSTKTARLSQIREQLAEGTPAVAPWSEQTFVTEEWRGWLMKYIASVVKELDKMINSECSLEEQTLWHLFTEFDANLDSVFDKNEMDQLFRNLDPDSSQQTVDSYQECLEACATTPGECTFVDFCKWWHLASSDENSPAATPALKMLILARGARDKVRRFSVGLFTQNMVQDRYDAADPAILEAILPQYRQALSDLRAWHLDLHLAEAEKLGQNWECAKKTFNIVREMLPEDDKILWEIFCEYDVTLDGILEKSEVEELLNELDKNADPELTEKRYSEMCAGEVKRAITFVDMITWWTSCEKGGVLRAQIALKIATSKAKAVGALFTTPAQEQRWQETPESQMATCIAGYRKVAVDLCEFQTRKLLEEAERIAA